MLERPGRLTHTAPTPNLKLNKILVSPGLHILQREDRRLVIGQTKERGGVSSVAYAISQKTDGSESQPPDTDEELGEQMLEAAKRLYPGLEGARVERVTCGYRPMPRDGLPITGFCTEDENKGSEGIYVNCMHSGITLGPLMGCLAALEIMKGLRVQLLEPYRPQRFPEFLAPNSDPK
mmetsp:Transcript_22155/g.34736  ORF Transcript_22155/g.34736 Transcript_22155/m.34736 type:complete len:178 (+) Transcript_22155:57-590(+)